MSHRIKVEKIKLTDMAVLRLAAKAVGAQLVNDGTVQPHRLYNAQVTGVGIQLPGWKYPVIVDQEGSIHYDNFNGHWGNQAQLDKLLQEYSVQKAKHEALMYGYTVTQQYVNDKGEVVLEIDVPE